jgi:hypothetical protein
MPPAKTFIDQQPKDGDTILHCGHYKAAPRPAHWFKYEPAISFERPDKTRGEASWLAVCEACFVKHGDKVPVRGDGRWNGDAPTIVKEEN